MSEVLRDRRALSNERLASLKGRLSTAKGIIAGKACVYATGSFARGEASQHSDLDLFIVGKTLNGDKRALSSLDEICAKAELVHANRDLGIQEFSGDGEYLVHYTTKQLISSLGHPEDDASNTFTARLLLLLESTALLGEETYREAIDEVIAAYWGDFADHKTDFVPAFLANDVLRLWRTFCVNYEARTSTDSDAKKAKRKLKNYKLKHSRMLTCYSALLYLLAIYSQAETVGPDDARNMARLTPTERLEHIATTLPKTAGAVEDLLEQYALFLQNTDASEAVLIDRFMDRSTCSKLFSEASEFGDKAWLIS